jgi:hypothetical protein
MARHATGSEVLVRARKDIAEAKTVEQLRTAQSVVFPLDLGLSLQEAAKVIGRSPSWVARARRLYIKGEVNFLSRAGWGGRRNQLMTEDEESALVKQGVINGSYSFTKTVRGEIRKLLEAKLDRLVAESTLNAIMLRVARQSIPNGTPTDLERLSARLTEKWLKERRTSMA